MRPAGQMRATTSPQIASVSGMIAPASRYWALPRDAEHGRSGGLSEEHVQVPPDKRGHG